ncbi:MAG TPA: hypothetical protein VME43_17105 [Bryobacteraceae bacterium]|nr:hypothetical protein [Bryobacteraceae bacterium]
MARRFLLLFAAIGALKAQQVVVPTPEQAGSPRGDNTGDYNITQSFELGYRFKDVFGDEGMYRSVVDVGNGLRLLSSSLGIYSKDGHGHYFDEITLNTIGLGNDNYQAAILRIQKNGIYRYDMTWRLNAYYNPGLTVAGGTHLEDTTRRLQDHDLTLFPQSHYRFHLGYSRNTENGPALTTSQEFDANGIGFPVFANIKRQWNEYRVGADLDYKGFRLTLQHHWDFFKDDTPLSADGVQASTEPNDQSVLQQFQRSQPVHGSNPGWLGNLYGRHKLWGVDARLTYNGGTGDFALDELATGISSFGTAASRQIAVGGNANRPDLAGDFNLSLFPSDRLTVVNNTSISSNRIDGQSSYTEADDGLNLGTTIYFRYLGVRLVTNSTDANYQVNQWFGIYGGYHYSDRLVTTVEGNANPAFANSSSSSLYQVSNHENAGVIGLRFRPLKPLTINLDGEVGRTANPLTPISTSDYHTLNGRVQYRLKNLQLSTSYKQDYNLNPPMSFSNYSSHARTYNGSASWTPRSWFLLDASYSKQHLDTLDGLAFFSQTTPLSPSQLQTSYSSLYISNIHSGNLGARIAFGKRADLYAGYTITKDTGDGRSAAATIGVSPLQALLDSVQTFPLTYHSPLARLSIRIAPKIRWNAGWQYYDYTEQFNLLGYNQNFHAHTGYTSVLWSF